MLTRLPPEAFLFRDGKTGALIRRVTSHPSIHHQPFFIVPAYDGASRYLFFISHRRGYPSCMAEDRLNHCLVEFTDREDINEWSYHPAFDGSRIYYTASNRLYFTDLQTAGEELLFDFGKASPKAAGMIAAGMGTISVSRDGAYIAARATRDSKTACLYIIDTRSGQGEIILERDEISHMQFKPDDSGVIYYAGPLTDRVWLINRDGSGNRRLYQRDAAKKEWITHESWVPNSNRLAFVDWPHGVRAVDIVTGEVTRLTGVNAWHAICSDDGGMMVCDTNFPDNGLLLFDPGSSALPVHTLCYPESSSLGAHWAGPFPYDNGPIKVYAPQHTHPHPRFSPDGRYVAYTSDVTGYSQVYEVTVPEEYVK